MAYQPDIETYHKHLPDLSIPRFTEMQKQDAHEYAKAFIEGGNPPWLHGLYLHWLKLYQEPFKGVTSDGNVKPNLFHLSPEEIPISSIVTATTNLLSLLSPSQLKSTLYHIDSPEWRTWSNPEFLLSNKGIRLDELTPLIRDAVLSVLQSSLSPEGYHKALSAMRINHFLGELVSAPKICNEHSYNFVLFGSPSTTTPWGYSFYGHHLCLNLFFYKDQVVISPWFTGAEPNMIDSGPYKGTQILQREEKLGLQLMQSLPAEKQTLAQVYKNLEDDAMPKGRWNHDDQRHLCGAYRDNRVVPYEGVLVSEMTQSQQDLVAEILDEYLLYLLSTARKIRLEQLKEWFHETYFCWIGGFGDHDAFYYRVQSPVILVEFDHHSGVFLTNKEPAKFHIHTLLRTPNGGDYGMALRGLVKEGVVEQRYLWEP
ncbi:uncharacterized protein PODANS_1_12160 [Podospora anserina S mat+]|uniref:Podospora anserina S mat+ genomic DNA chromosome 1, supercontig 2 n=1 Tax=Podospora anserina (strain S / ATCC MYA-4624 / DSM 980 / FGSC 10383) TaxID=515849 RepID=B2AYT4_PODAN|nr:uncharacterized protein PODANS_1_12160 [Podospora anserina S mat+]CAP69558.1 unnamed protein product [Podospora anserina S mat+]CDP23575.1 Putative protein of unknown function [Podospora anserina S mat+]